MVLVFIYHLNKHKKTWTIYIVYVLEVSANTYVS